MCGTGEQPPRSDQSFSRRWRDAHRTFAECGLPEYRPPRFADGVNVYEVIAPLEEELGVVIDFVGYGVSSDDTWFVRVDSDPVGRVERERRIGGQTVYHLDSDEFRDLVCEAVREDDGYSSDR